MDICFLLHMGLCFSFFKFSIPLCALINQHLSGLAKKFQDVKFVKAISTTCIPNYPDRNLPTIFVYLEGDIKAQFIGPLVFGGMNLTRDGECLFLNKQNSSLHRKLVKVVCHQTSVYSYFPSLNNLHIQKVKVEKNKIY